MKKLGEFLFLITLFALLFNYLEFGWSWDQQFKFLYSFSLSCVSATVILKPNLRSLFLKASLILLAIMVLFYLTNQLGAANILGSFGFAILLVVVCSYMPNLIKEGHI